MKCSMHIDRGELEALYLESKIMELHGKLKNGVPDTSQWCFSAASVISRAESLIALRSVCRSDDGWELQKESHDVRTLYKHNESAPQIHSIRLEGKVDAPVFYLLALLHEVDLFEKWIPTYSFLGLNFAKCVSHPTPTELLIHLNVNVPWPFDNRYAFFLCDGIDCMDDHPKQIGVILSNLTSESEFQIEETGVKAAFHPPSGILLTPLEGGKTEVQIVINVDPQIAVVPTWLIDFAVRNLGFLILLAIRRAVNIVKEDPEYHTRMTDPDNSFYQHIRRRITASIPGEAQFIPPVREPDDSFESAEDASA